jgi:hypothetical protein
MRLLIEYGADLNAFIPETIKDPAVNVSQLIGLILTRFGSKDVYDLRETLMEHPKTDDQPTACVVIAESPR